MFHMWTLCPPSPAAQQALSSLLIPGTDMNIFLGFHCLGNVTGESYLGEYRENLHFHRTLDLCWILKHVSGMCATKSVQTLHVHPLCGCCHHVLAHLGTASSEHPF